MKNTLQKKIESLTIGSIYKAMGATFQYEGNGTLRNINASVGDSRLVTCGIINSTLVEALEPSTMTREEFDSAWRNSTLAVSDFYEKNAINA